MKVKCEFCGSWIEESDKQCPNCGAVNERFKRVGNGVPTTIEELREWARAHNLPLADMRTYIGEDYKGAKAFGIYKDEVTGNFVVYKNKADGSRSIRYEGPDETYAVNELYLKMKERVTVQKAHQAGNGSNGGKAGQKVRKKKSLSSIILSIAICCGILYIICAAFFSLDGISTGYYYYDNNQYYYQGANHSWYLYDTYSDEWETAYPDSSLVDYADDYYDGYSYSGNPDYSDFTSSDYYMEPDDSWDSDSDWDTDSDWDSGSDWDTGYDDWDSDW